jgi:hypothetical protein
VPLHSQPGRLASGLRSYPVRIALGLLCLGLLTAAGVGLARGAGTPNRTEPTVQGADLAAEDRDDRASRNLARTVPTSAPAPPPTTSPAPAPASRATPRAIPPTTRSPRAVTSPSPRRTTTKPPAPAVPSGCTGYSGNRRTGCSLLSTFGFGLDQMSALDQLWTHESGWNQYARNPSSGAYGIPQALPGDKMATAGSDWATNPATQIKWGLGYIRDRYGSPVRAWNFWQANNWY